MEVSHHLFYSKIDDNKKTSKSEDSSDSESLSDDVKRRLIIDTCHGIQEKAKILSLRNKSVETNDQHYPEIMKTLYNNSLIQSTKKSAPRAIATTPDRILDAPDFRDDYCKALFKK